MKNSLIVVADCDRKIWDGFPEYGACAAASAFTSRYFAMNLAFAKQFGTAQRVLSAKHGFIPPEFEIPGPYFNRLTRTGERMELAALRSQVKEQKLYLYNDILGLGGHKFATVLSASFNEWPVRLHFPLAGLPIGEQQKTISHALWSGRFFLPSEE